MNKQCVDIPGYQATEDPHVINIKHSRTPQKRKFVCGTDKVCISNTSMKKDIAFWILVGAFFLAVTVGIIFILIYFGISNRNNGNSIKVERL